MNIRELEYFMMIVEKQNLTNAAQELYVSQPTLSKYIDRLEEEIGTPLFEKVNRTMKLTYAGERYLHYVRQILAIKSDLDLEMRQIQKENKGVLKVGIPALRSDILLPQVLPLFKEKYPNITIEIIGGSSQTLDNKMKDGKIDIVFYYKGIETDPDFCYELMGQDRIGVVLPDHHPLNEKLESMGKKTIPISWLFDETILLQNKSTRHGQIVNEIIEEFQFKNVQHCENDYTFSILMLAKNGYGVVFSSNVFVQGADFKFYDLENYEKTIDFVVAYRNKTVLPNYAKEFISLVREISYKNK